MIVIRKLSLVICLLLSAAAAFAFENPSGSVATVVALRGQVTALDKEGNIRELSLKSPVYLHDTLITEKQGRAQILFSDNSIISLGRSTVIRIADYSRQQDGNTDRMTTEIRKGVFRFMGGLISRHLPQKVISKTPSTTIGIRGSMYSGIIDSQGTTIFFEGGKGIDLANGAGRLALIRPGYSSKISAWNTMPGNPQRMSKQEVKSLLQGIDVNQTAQPHKMHRPGAIKINKMVDFSRAEQQALYGRNVTLRVEEQPQRAAEILQKAVNSGRLDVNKGLYSALLGMKNVDRRSFDELVRKAVSLGLTSEQAENIAEQIKESGLCQ